MWVRCRFAAVAIYVGLYRFATITICAAACDPTISVVQNKLIVIQIRCDTYFFFICALSSLSVQDYP